MPTVLFAQLSGAGPAIIVVCCLALLGIIGFFLVSYFAHSFLIVVIDSAAGVNEIRWPSESIADWVTKPIYVMWVLLPILFVPSIVLVATGDGISFLITLVALLWFLAPVMFLSSLAAKSWMAFFYGPFLKRWARFFFAYVIFLLWSAPVTALGAALLVWSMYSPAGVAVSAFFLPPLFLLYFRLLGRYAWYVTTRRMRKAKKKKMPNPAKGLKIESLDPWAAPPKVDELETGVEVHEPTEVRDKLLPAEEETQLEEDEWSPKKKPYAVMTETQARESWVERQGTSIPDPESYAVDDLSLAPPVSLWQYYADREKKEEELRAQGKSVRQYERPRKPPTLWQAMTQEIVSFLFYSHTLRCWMNLGILFGVVLILLNTIVAITGVLQRM